MNVRHALRLSSCALLTAALAACGGGSSDTGPKNITLDFTAVAGTTPVKCGTLITGLGSGSVSAQLKDLRFYVSNVQMVKADGTKVALALGANDDWNLTSGTDSVTMIDLEDGTGSCLSGTDGVGTTATNSQIKGTAPAGDYVGIELTMGVPFALNHSDYAKAIKPLDVGALAWSWQSGRKFAKMEFTDPNGTAGTWTAKTFNFHLGSTGCTGDAINGATVTCKAPNRMTFALSTFNPDTQKIAVDVQSLLAGTDITKNAAGAAGCMSGGTDPECLNVFKALAIDWKADGTGTGLPVANGASQTLFKAVTK